MSERVRVMVIDTVFHIHVLVVLFRRYPSQMFSSVPTINIISFGDIYFDQLLVLCISCSEGVLPAILGLGYHATSSSEETEGQLPVAYGIDPFSQRAACFIDRCIRVRYTEKFGVEKRPVANDKVKFLTVYKSLLQPFLNLIHAAKMFEYLSFSGIVTHWVEEQTHR